MQPWAPRYSVRTLFISDVHLGGNACRAHELQQLLKWVHCDVLYIVGDLIDGWRGTLGGRWTQAHTNVVRTLLGKTKHGVEIRYAPGNHDAFLRRIDSAEFGSIRIARQFVHTLEDGRTLLVRHGDEFDRSWTGRTRLAKAAILLHDLVLLVSEAHNHRRAKRGKAPVDPLTLLKRRLRRWREHCQDFESNARHHARDSGFDGIVCGHLHQPGLDQADGSLYANSGDWVSHCTALVEHWDGKLELIDWNLLSCEIDWSLVEPREELALCHPTP